MENVLFLAIGVIIGHVFGYARGLEKAKSTLIKSLNRRGYVNNKIEETEVAHKAMKEAVRLYIAE
jgi:hypothetical protein